MTEDDGGAEERRFLQCFTGSDARLGIRAFSWTEESLPTVPVPPPQASTLELCLGRDRSNDMQLSMMEQQEDAHTVRLTEVLPLPAITTGRLTRQELNLKSALCKSCFTGPNAAMIWNTRFSSLLAPVPPTLVPPVELCPGGGGSSGKQLLEQLKDVHVVRLAKGLHAPPATMGSLTRQKLIAPPKYCSGAKLAMRLGKRVFSSSSGPESSQTPSVPVPVPPPPGWEYPFCDERPLRRSGPPGYLEPDFARMVKTLPAIVPQVCVDESVYVSNYEPLEYIKSLPLVRKKIIHGFEPDNDGHLPTVLFPVDAGLHLMRSLPMLARFFHYQSCCLPRITLKDLVISGDGRFRLRGCDIELREFTFENVKDVYANINLLFEEMLAPYGKTTEILGYHPHLNYQFENYGADDTSEYLINFNSFFLPLGNKGPALLRLIDFILELPTDSDIYRVAVFDLPYLEWNGKGKKEWLGLALDNAYLKQWYDYRRYGDGCKEFLRFVRAVLSHKLKFGLTHRFVDFLLFATYPKLLPTLQRNFGDMQMIDRFQFEELFPEKLASKFA